MNASTIFSEPLYLVSSLIFILGFLLVWLITFRTLSVRHSNTLETKENEYEALLSMHDAFKLQIASLESSDNLKSQEIEYLKADNLEKKNHIEQVKYDLEHKLELMRSDVSKLNIELASYKEKAKGSEQKSANIKSLSAQIETLKMELAKSKSNLEVQKAAFEQEKIAFDEKLAILKDAEKSLSQQFENTANKILEQKSMSFSETNEKGMKQLLDPLKTQLDGFKKQISEQYVSEVKERSSLRTEILNLQMLNKQITEEAAALTNALKGDNKQQGNWGEMVLERILIESGLRNGHEYETQKSLESEEGKRYQPDVVVHLPNEKDIVIDSKVSLLHFERYINSHDEQEKETALKAHINSIRGHIKSLSKKDYQALQGLRTLDYVLMFIPIESAFISAVEHDSGLINLALENQIMLVSPTNLLVALRTINNIWQYEHQNQNAAKIAEQGKKMYNKFVGFLEDLDKLGKSLDTANSHYASTLNKLKYGRGNLIGQAEKLKDLGLQPTKNIDQKFIDSSD